MRNGGGNLAATRAAPVAVSYTQIASRSRPSEHATLTSFASALNIGDKRSQVIREMLDWFDRYLGTVH